MAITTAAIHRPQRWTVPFGPDMTEEDVQRVLARAPFSNIDPGAFPAALPLDRIIRNDSRIMRFRKGDIIVREGDYGSSLFYVMHGSVRVVTQAMPDQLLGRRETQRKGLLRSIAQLWTNHRTVEYRDARRYVDLGANAAQRGAGDQARIFLQDVPAVLDEHRTVALQEGVFFGEMAALARIPRTATIFAECDCELLEMRWQGFRDIRRRDEAIRKHVDQLYRERSLLIHLHSTPMFSHLGIDEVREIAEQVTFETLGEFDWYGSYKKLAEQDPSRRLAHEPILAEEGHYPNGLILIRSGFARVSRRFGDGERTISYLGSGQSYGLDEIGEAYRTGQTVPLRSTLRALGYVDILRVPTVLVEKYALDHSAATLPPHRVQSSAEEPIDPGTLEMLVEQRFINGSATMLINLDRCTGCDDCVRACASTHDGNPRFVRHGQQHGNHMIANACMHCADPVCMIGCPTGAIHRDPTGGQVVINDLTCIGCGTCASSCPYHNIRMVEIRDGQGQFVWDDHGEGTIFKATKCDLCIDQLAGPACQRACPHDALARIDMSDTAALARYLQR